MDMNIKVCGMREPANISEAAKLDINLLGFIFWAKSKRSVGNAPGKPEVDYHDLIASIDQAKANGKKTVGVFVDAMPQDIIAVVSNYHLDYVQLHGNESPTYISNLRSTMVPDLNADLKIIKAISISEAADITKCEAYDGVADLLLFDTKTEGKGGSGQKFDWTIIDGYKGRTPFLLSGGIGPGDAEALKAFSHPMCIGIDINSRFETEPGHKYTDLIRDFVSEIRNQ